MTDLDPDSARLNEAERVLGSTATREVPRTVTGERAGLVVRFRSNVGAAIEVDLPAALHDILLKVIPENTFTREKLREGATVDVVTGDPEFDRRFHVEGAPSDVVRALLDDPLRAWMVAHAATMLELRNHATIRLTVENLPPAEIAQAIDLVVTFTTGAAARARSAVMARGADPQGTQGYRDSPSAALVESRHTTAQVEVARLREEIAIKDRRISWSMWFCLLAPAVPWLYFAPLWVAIIGIVSTPIVSMLAFGLLYVVADSLGLGAFMRWWDRRRRARFERKLARLLPPRPE